jgi:hypothetical protein
MVGKSHGARGLCLFTEYHDISFGRRPCVIEIFCLRLPYLVTTTACAVLSRIFKDTTQSVSTAQLCIGVDLLCEYL